jgi:hypothetical protein
VTHDLRVLAYGHAVAHMEDGVVSRVTAAPAARPGRPAADVESWG